MSHDDQIPFDYPELVANPEPRCACLLVLDTSGWMRGQPIAELNAGLVTLRDELMADAMAAQRVEIAVITFGPVRVQSDFQSPDTWTPPHLQPTGDTPMGAAIEQGLKLLHTRKQVYRHSGITYYRPWVFLITDGAPPIAGGTPLPSFMQATTMSGRAFRFLPSESKGRTWKSWPRSADASR